MKIHKTCSNNGCIWETQNIVNLNLEEKKNSEQKHKDSRIIKGARHSDPRNNYIFYMVGKERGQLYK